MDMSVIIAEVNKLKWEALLVACLINLVGEPEEVKKSALELARSYRELENALKAMVS